MVHVAFTSSQQTRRVHATGGAVLFQGKVGYFKRGTYESLESGWFAVTVSLKFVCCWMWSLLSTWSVARLLGRVNDSRNLKHTESKDASREHACVIPPLLGLNKCSHSIFPMQLVDAIKQGLSSTVPKPNFSNVHSHSITYTCGLMIGVYLLVVVLRLVR